MALRTAEEYKKGLNDGRKVFILGNPVPDVTEDPYIKVVVETAAFDFLMAHDPELKHIPVIMLTALSKKTFFHSQHVLDQYKGESIPEPEGYIEKPPEPEELVEAIQNALANKA